MANYAIIENGVVVNIVIWDGMAEWSPNVGQTVKEIQDGDVAAIGYTVANGEFVAPVVRAPTHEELVAEAERQKSQILLTINETTQILQTQLALGIITDEDKVTLTMWMKYAQEVQAIDTSAAPDITWPTEP